MILWVGAIVAILVGAVLLHRRSERAVTDASNTRTERRTLRDSGKYHAVSIRIGLSACTAAEALRGRRYLSAAAPLLPLNDCNSANCQCRFVHHGDRRAGDDRRSPFQRGFGGSASRVTEDRRNDSDRRDDTGPQDFRLQ